MVRMFLLIDGTAPLECKGARRRLSLPMMKPASEPGRRLPLARNAAHAQVFDLEKLLYPDFVHRCHQIFTPIQFQQFA
jgi:hypothetical protein